MSQSRLLMAVLSAFVAVSAAPAQAQQDWPNRPLKIITGFQPADSGTMWLNGQTYAPKSVEEARKLGVDTVFQDLALIDELSVFQNMFLHREVIGRDAVCG